MSSTKNFDYNNIPFSPEFPQYEFYTSATVRELATKCRNNKDTISKCRTIGILESVNGKFYITDISLPLHKPDAAVLQVSMIYLKESPPSTVIPQTIQLFGSLEWDKKPVIYATAIQLLITPMALRLKQAIDGITQKHLARPDQDVENTAL